MTNAIQILSDEHWDVVVVGGGAAGFFAAIHVARSRLLKRVAVIEGSNQFLSKVRASGGGRCNVTHSCFDPKELVKNYPRGRKELLGLFNRFQPNHTIEWFKGRGVDLKCEQDGRIFPVSNCSDTVIDCFLKSAKDLNINLFLGAKITSLHTSPKGFEISCQNGPTFSATKVLLATGSAPGGYRLAQMLGHKITPLAPSLFSFKIIDPLLQGLAGLSFLDSELELCTSKERIFKQSGPLLITHWGLSGPAVLKLSSWAARELNEDHYQAQLRVSWDRQLTKSKLEEGFSNARQHVMQRRIRGHPLCAVPARFWERLCDLANLPPDTTFANLTNRHRQDITNRVFNSTLCIVGKGQFKEEFVTCGGVDLKEVDFKTMQSKLCHGLFFAGELLDIDGITGGFNFQSAWSTGWQAAQGILEKE